jgi:hypothetical protein
MWNVGQLREYMAPCLRRLPSSSPSPWGPKIYLQYSSLKRRSTTRLHAVISQKDVKFILATVKKNWNLPLVCSSETSVYFYETIQHHVPEECHRHNPFSELKIEALCFSETSGYRPTRCLLPRRSTLTGAGLLTQHTYFETWEFRNQEFCLQYEKIFSNLAFIHRNLSSIAGKSIGGIHACNVQI